MCFRPPSAAKVKKCEVCGTLNAPIAKTCIKCKAELNKDAPPKKQGQ